ncbi:MAG: hypothetical protein ABRQ26_06155 [Syntrophomonadaceae bacterium]
MFQCRCPRCNRLVGLLHGIAEIKCPRCGQVHLYNFSSEIQEEDGSPHHNIRASTKELPLVNSKA